MTRKDIIDAYCEIRKTNTNIPDEVLDFMKDAAIEKHKIMEREFPQLFKAFINEPIEKKGSENISLIWNIMKIIYIVMNVVKTINQNLFIKELVHREKYGIAKLANKNT